jgi:hypothetical protein
MRHFIKTFLILFLLVLALPQLQYAQNKKLKRGKIRQIVVMGLKGNEVQMVKQSEKTLAKSGEYLEEIDYKTDGTIESKISYKYDNLDNLIEQLTYGLDKKTESKELILKEKKVMKYNGFNEMTEEWIYDKNGKLDKKIIYEYNKDSLVSSKTTYDAENKVLSQKKYLYQKF